MQATDLNTVWEKIFKILKPIRHYTEENTANKQNHDEK